MDEIRGRAKKKYARAHRRCEIRSTAQKEIGLALASGLTVDADAGVSDLEDAIQYFSAVRAGADCIISRDARAFPKSDLPVLTPQEMLAAGLPGD